MERPTCGTCPYLAVNNPAFPNHSVSSFNIGQCRKHPPQFAATDTQYKELCDICWDCFAGIWPNVDDGDWCGEHPDFPAYIQSLKEEKDAGDPRKTVKQQFGPL